MATMKPAYSALLADGCRKAGVAVWVYCLMPNHVHLVLVPADKQGLRAALAEAHRRYAREVNFREGWRGYPWQGRFASFPIDRECLLACARYVELNPVRAKLVGTARDWRWSGARVHLAARDDGLVATAPLLDRTGDSKAFLREGLDASARDAIRSSERTGRPLGAQTFICKLEKRLQRTLTRSKPGPSQAAQPDSDIALAIFSIVSPELLLLEAGELEPAVAVRCAHHGNLDMLIAQSSDASGPFSFDRGPPFELEAEFAKEINRPREVFDDDSYVVHPLERHVSNLQRVVPISRASRSPTTDVRCAPNTDSTIA